MVNRDIVEAAKKLIVDCMGTKEDEKLLIVTDEKKFEIGYGFAVAGRELGFNTTFVEATSQTKGEPPATVAAAMAEADVEFLITSMSYSHVKARIVATERGARVASMPLLTTEIAQEYLNATTASIFRARRSCSRTTTSRYAATATPRSGPDGCCGRAARCISRPETRSCSKPVRISHLKGRDRSCA